MQKSTRFLALLSVLLALFAATFVDAHLRCSGALDELAQQKSLVRELGISDLSLFTEARYTRHLTQADRHTPFQDHPLALDHFPSGSLTPPQPGSPQ